VNALLAQLGLSATAGAVSPVGVPTSTPGQVFNNPLVQLGGVNPLAALAANNPAAALAALSPALGIFNPAINPNAGLLAFNPAGAPTQALASKQGKATLPFGKFWKWPFGI
jgi:hypothetical protein